MTVSFFNSGLFSFLSLQLNVASHVGHVSCNEVVFPFNMMGGGGGRNLAMKKGGDKIVV